MTTGEGGAVAVQTEEEWRLLKSLSNQGRADSGGWLEHARFGYNYRLDDLSAALGLAQVEKLDEILELRGGGRRALRGAARRDRRRRAPLADDVEHQRSWFVYLVRLADGIDRERRHRAAGASRASPRSRTCPRSTCSPTGASGSGRRRGCSRSPRTRAAARSRSRSTPASSASIRSASPRRSPRPCDNQNMADGAPKMVFLGFGKFARADKIYALEPLTGGDRGDGRRTRVWVEGIPEPIVASRTERSILGEMGIRDAGRVQILDDAVALAERIVEDAEQGRRRPRRPRPAGAPACSSRREAERRRPALLARDARPRVLRAERARGRARARSAARCSSTGSAGRSSRSRPTTTRIRRATASAARRPATARCSARPATRTSTAPTASTGASTSSARRRASRPRCSSARSSPSRRRRDARPSRPRRAAPARLRPRPPLPGARRHRGATTGCRSTARLRAPLAREAEPEVVTRPPHRDHARGRASVALRPGRLAVSSRSFPATARRPA